MCILCDRNNKEIKNIEELVINCNKITKIPYIKGLKKLTCSECLNLEIIVADIKSLEILYCSGCPKLKFIPKFKKLKELECSYTNITKIPYINTLRELDCGDCPNIKEVPRMKSLKKLLCSRCDSLLSINSNDKNKNIKIWSFDNSVWLNNENLEKIKILQKYIKKYTLSNRMLKIINKLVPIYYHPECKGGYFIKKDMLKFLNNI